MIEKYFKDRFYKGIGSFADKQTVAVEGKVGAIEYPISRLLARGRINLDDESLDFEVDGRSTTPDFGEKVSKREAREWLNSIVELDDDIELVGIYDHKKRRLRAYRVWIGNRTLGLNGDYF
jgi:hypothetical protein